jgi:hypothetical protein
LDFEFWPGYWIARVNFIFFKLKWLRFSKKKKSQRVATRFLTGFCRAGSPSHTGFFLSLFFLQPGPVPAPDLPGPGSTRRAGLGFKTIWKYITFFYFLKFHFDIITLRWFEDTKKKKFETKKKIKKYSIFFIKHF